MIRTRVKVVAAAIACALALGAAPASSQVQSIDPDTAIDSDLVPLAQQSGSTAGTTPALPAEPLPTTLESPPASAAGELPAATAAVPASPAANSPASPPPATPAAAGAAQSATGGYREDDLIGAAEGVFGKGAAGLADLIKDLLKKQGEPNAYIVGREVSAALVVGLRYGSGTLHHKIEGERPVYWTGPSIGFDAGANAASTFVLVYNLYDSEELYARFPAGEGQAYLVGGFHVSYLRKGDKVLIPVRSGAGLRLGINGGYMKFSRKQRWLPF